MKKLSRTLLVIGAMVSPLLVNAQSSETVYQYEENVQQAAAPIYQDPTGVQVKLNKDGSFRAILATGEAELQFGDRKDVRQAISKATMRAKAAISKFMSESIATTETLEEITNTLSANDTTTNTASAQRDVVETYIEGITNSSSTVLTGVVTLMQDINKDAKYVIVTVGVKEQTIRAAAGFSQQINQGLQDGKMTSSQAARKAAQSTKSTITVTNSTNEVRKSEMYDAF